MQQRLSLITLGVRDLPRSRAFYEQGLGWKPAASSQESVTFYDLGGYALGLYGLEALAEDAQLPLGGGGFGGITLAYNTHSREDVDRLLAEAVAAGANLLKPAGEVFWGGYHGYFADPDGYPWEVAHNPGFELDEAGRITKI
jgi:catechol 2,3-dioxygenase-like lactoylglutathione lyase family enzyme